MAELSSGNRDHMDYKTLPKKSTLALALETLNRKEKN